MMRCLTLLAGIGLIAGTGQAVLAKPKLEYPRPSPDVCVPNAAGYGHFYQKEWRQWPGESRPEQINPRSVGAGVLPTPPGQEALPLPQGTPSPGATPLVPTPTKPEGTAPPSEQPKPPGGLPIEPPAEPKPPSGLPTEPPAGPKPAEPPAEPKPQEPPKSQSEGGVPGLSSEVVPPSSPAPKEETKPAEDAKPPEEPPPKETPKSKDASTSKVHAIACDDESEWRAASEAHRADLIAATHKVPVREVEPAAYAMAESAATAEVAAEQVAVPRVALMGYCPVELTHSGRWTRGDLRWTVVYKGWIYRLSGAAERQQFLANPEAFVPAQSGNDPVLAADENRIIPGQATHCALYDGRLYLFSSAATQARFNQTPQRYAAKGEHGASGN